MTLLQPRGAPSRGPRGKRRSENAATRRRGTARIRGIRPPRPVLDRRAALSRVLALWPQELDDLSPAGRQRILVKLRGALRAERRRGVAGHWTYDLARHVELLHLYRQELALLKAQRKGVRTEVQKGR